MNARASSTAAHTNVVAYASASGPVSRWRTSSGRSRNEVVSGAWAPGGACACSCATTGASLSFASLNRITDSMAVPIEAATCWMMFRLVDARAMFSGFSVFSAIDMIGIIDMPMPMPSTNSETPIAQYDVTSVSWVNTTIDPTMIRMPSWAVRAA